MNTPGWIKTAALLALAVLAVPGLAATQGKGKAAHDAKGGKGAPQESAELKALRRESEALEAKLEALRAKEMRLRAAEKRTAAAKAMEEGDKEWATALENEAKAMEEGAKVQERLGTLRGKIREARQSGDGAKAKALAEEASKLEAQMRRERFSREILTHTDRLKRLQAMGRMGEKHLMVELQDAREQKDDARVAKIEEAQALGKQVQAVVAELLADADGIKAAEAKGDKEGMALLLRQAEAKKLNLQTLLEKMATVMPMPGPMRPMRPMGSDGPGGPGGLDGPDSPGGPDGPGGLGGPDGPGGPGGPDGPGPGGPEGRP